MTTAHGASKFAARRTATRAALVQLGLERFPLKGYSGTTVEDLIRASDYTRGAFYFHFRGKEDFFLAVLEYRAELRDEWWLVASDPRHTTTRQAVMATLAHLNALHDGGAWLMLIADFFQATGRDAAYVATLRELYGAWIVELTRFVEALQQRGLARTDVAAQALAAQAFATAEGHTIHRVLYGLDGELVADSLVRLLEV